MPPKAAVQAMFGRVARRYDFLNHFLSLHIDRLWRRRAVRCVSPLKTKDVLDVCCGTGDLAFAFARAGARVVGSDFTKEMIALAAAKRESRDAGGPEFLIADTLELPFADERFDVVSVAFGIRNVENVDAGIREMARVARPGGKVLILEFSRPPGRVFGPLYLFYFRILLPRVGAVLSRRSAGAYRYLPESVMGFPDPELLASKMRAAGLETVRYERLTRGIATLHVGQKPRGDSR